MSKRSWRFKRGQFVEQANARNAGRKIPFLFLVAARKIEGAL